LLSQNFQLIEDQSGITYLSVPFFDKLGVTVSAFSTRSKSAGLPPFYGLNMAFHVGDNPEVVIKNRKRLCQALSLSLESWVAGKQVHGDTVAEIDRQHLGRGAFDMIGALPNTDGLVCMEPNIALTAFFADCVPIFLLDPVKKAIGLAHAGWKGTVMEIAQKTLQKMQESFGTNPSDCLAAIGPSIGSCCYEVDAPVLNVVKERLPYAKALIEPVFGEKGMLDLWQANAIALKKAGIPAGSIAMSGLCSACNTKMFFSHRKEGGRTGRMIALLMLK